MPANSRAHYFNSIASQWDSWERPDIQALLHRELAQFEVGPDELVVDMGCGTGNLTLALLSTLSPKGRVIGVDIASQMLNVARHKVRDARATWYTADAGSLPLPNCSVDRIFCYSAWPHIPDPEPVLAEFHRVLQYHGALHIWHLIPREQVNAIHSSAGEAVRADLLAPAVEVASTVAHAGFQVRKVVDDDQRYLVSAIKCTP